MPTYVLLTKLSPEALKDYGTPEELNTKITEKIKTHCPQVKWVCNYALLGRYDYLDIFEAPSEEMAAKVATLIRSIGHATTETWSAIPWEKFVSTVGEMTAVARK